MPHEYTYKALRSPVVQRKPLVSLSDEPELATKQPDIVSLQRLVGNRGVQSLMAQGRLSSRGLVQTKPAIQRCSCGGSCAACKGQEDELAVSAGTGNQVQRFWGDDEEEDGGSWLDSATDWVSDTASDAADWASQTGGGVGGGETSKESDSESGGSWLDDAYDWASDKAGDAAEWASEKWDEIQGDEGGEEEDDDWLPDWLPDIDIPALSDDEGEEDPLDIGDIEVEVAGDDVGQGVCMSEEASGQGGGTSGGVTVAGLTKIDWSATTGAGSFLNPSISKRKVGKNTVYDVSGKVHIDYSGADAKIDFKVTPPLSQLNTCKQEKVNAFKGPSGDLGKHEASHKAKMDAFNGSEEFNHTFTGLEASSTEELTQKVNAALDAVVKPKIKARQDAAQAASDSLDQPPWSKPIPDIDKCP